jgi:hypothetical protein
MSICERKHSQGFSKKFDFFIAQEKEDGCQLTRSNKKLVLNAKNLSKARAYFHSMIRCHKN